MKYQQNKNILSTVLDEEICVFNPNNAEYLTLNETASFIWQLLENKVKLDFVFKQVKDIYDVKSEIYKDNIKSFIKENVERELICEYQE